MQEEATEDIQKMAAILPNEKPYLKQSVFSIWKARIPWLIMLMLTSTFTSIILAGYESKLSPVLYAFVPMLMGTAGNAGGQTSVTIIRALALCEVNHKDVFRVILKELLVSLAIGISVAVVCFGKLMLLDRLYDPSITVSVSMVISVVCLISIVLAKLVGCLLPILVKIIRLDPAVVASPVMTTIVDALSLIIYCSISIAILG
jgi:magnesium transporter